MPSAHAPTSLKCSHLMLFVFALSAKTSTVANFLPIPDIQYLT